MDRRVFLGTAAATANGFPANSPYNADLPYDIKQFAIFGEVSYDITEALTATAGGRYYDFKETRSFKSGGLFANGDNRTDSTKSPMGCSRTGNNWLSSRPTIIDIRLSPSMLSARCRPM